MEGGKIYKNCKSYKVYTSYICLAVLVFGAGVLLASADSVVIENNVSAEASAGGNVVEGRGKIKTGSASATAESSVKANTSGEDGRTKIDAKAEVTADGEKKTKEVHKEIEGSANKEVRVEAESGSEGNETEMNAEETQKENNPEKFQNTETGEENKSFFISVAQNISNAIKGVFDKLISFFS